MTVLTLILILVTLSLFFWVFRSHVISLFYYLLVRFERRKINSQLLSSLRDDLVHERKKKIAGLEMILSSWEKGDEVQPRYEYFEQLVDQLKNLVLEQRRNLMAVTGDIFLWGKLWIMLRRIEKTSSEKKEKSDAPKLRKDLILFQNVIEEIVEDATKRFSFTLNEVVKESVKIVKIEKSKLKNIEITEQLDDVGDTVRFSYDKFKQWQRVLTNLIRNAVEAVEAKQSGTGGLGLVAAVRETGQGGDETVAADFSLRGGGKIGCVKISTQAIHSVSVPVSVCIEDSGIGMDESTKASFYKKGFTSGKEGGLGLGVSEESIQFLNRYGNWQIESQKGVGTKITINIDREKAQKAELILPVPKPFFQTKLAFGLSFFLLVLIALALLFAFHKYSRFWQDWNPASFGVPQENRLTVKNKSGDVLWDVLLPSRIMLSFPKRTEPLVKLTDLDDDGRNEVLVGIDFTESTTGKFICFNYRKEKLWEFACGDSGIYQGCNGYFSPGNILVEDLFGDSKKEIIVNSAHSIWFPDQVAILDKKGNKLSEYWHPGVFNCLYCLDFDNDEKKEIILGGGNNRMGWRPVVSILEPKRMFGQAIPYNAAKEIEKAKEEWYIVFPHIKKSLPDESKWVHSLSWVYHIRSFTEDDEVQVNLQDGRNYFLRLNFEVKNIYFYPSGFLGWKEKWKFPYDLTEEDEENWKNIEVWKEGIRIR